MACLKAEGKERESDDVTERRNNRRGDKSQEGDVIKGAEGGIN